MTPFDRSTGPFDRSEAEDISDRVDLGGLVLTGVEGMQLRLEVDQQQQQVIAATAVIGDSSMQIQAFAAPRTTGLWAEIRDEIAASIVEKGGTAEEVQGPLGVELRTRMPSQDKAGRTVFAPARFLGVDGPRWFLRGVLSGRAAVQEDTVGPLVDIFRSTIVVRGDEPMAPREMLPLTLPKVPESESSAADPEGAGDAETSSGSPARAADELNPFERGPEITEVR